MSRIQNILDKAEREGATLRTSRLDVPAAATVPITIEIPTPGAPLPEAPATIVPGASGPTHAHAQTTASTAAADMFEHFTRPAEPAAHRGAVAEIARRRAVSSAAHAALARGRGDRAPNDSHHEPAKGRRQVDHRRQPGADHGAGAPAARRARRSRPAQAVAAAAVRPAGWPRPRRIPVGRLRAARRDEIPPSSTT